MNIDMHCHLDLYPNPFKVAAQCREKEVYVLSVTTTPKAWVGTKRLAAGCDTIKTALGLHPQLAHQRSHELELFDMLLPEANYVGEIGLDGGRGFNEHWNIQLKVFRHILKSVNQTGGRVMSIHSRASTSAVLDELTKISAIPIIHWFTGTKRELIRAVEMGCWFSVGPAMLQTKKGVEITSCIPIDRILTETDGPFAKYDGRPLMPWDVKHSLSCLSAIWKISEDEARRNILDNIKELHNYSNRLTAFPKLHLQIESTKKYD